MQHNFLNRKQMTFVGVAAGVSAGTGLFKLFKGLHQDHLANKVQIPEASYETSPYAQKMLAEATRLKNSQMPGMSAATQNIYGNQANAMGSVDRNATSGSQALAMLGAIQGNTNQAFQGLANQQNQYAQNQAQNYNQANMAMINEGDKVYEDRVRQQQQAIAEKNALRGAGTQNFGGGLNDLTNSAFLAAQMGIGGNKGRNRSNINGLSVDNTNQAPIYNDGALYG
jgi:hypothetical protein